VLTDIKQQHLNSAAVFFCAKLTIKNSMTEGTNHLKKISFPGIIPVPENFF